MIGEKEKKRKGAVKIFLRGGKVRKILMGWAKTGLLLLALSAPIGLVYADEVIDSIQEGLKQYKSGDYAAATGSLDYASQLIRQKRGEDLKVFLPDPLPGWKAKEATSSAVGSAMLGGGINVERLYQKGSSSVTITFITDSPLLQSTMMMFSNPMFATAGGGKMEKIGGEKAIVKYQSENQGGDVTIIVAGRFLVSVKGKKVSREDLTSYAGKINYKKLAAFP